MGDGEGATSADYYFDSYGHFGIHEEMLKDRVRTESYRRALSPGAVRGKVVVDVGCGTGILCLFAARNGARHCYGIECAGIAEQTRKIVAASGYADRITIIRGRVEDVQLPEKADVLVSEWMGYCLLYESMLRSVVHARDAFLAPGGVVLPDRCTLQLCGIEDAEYRESKIDWWHNVYGFDMGCIAELALDEPLVDVVEERMVATSTAHLKTFDIARIGLAEDELYLPQTPFELVALREDFVHALVFSFDTFFTASNISFSTSPHAKYTHWKQTVLYLPEALSMRKGEALRGTIEIRPNRKNPRDLNISLTCTLSGTYQAVTLAHEYHMH